MAKGEGYEAKRFEGLNKKGNTPVGKAINPNKAGKQPVGNVWDSAANNDYDKAHFNSDTDITSQSIHHTLGNGPFQAAPGNLGFQVGDIKISTDLGTLKGWLPCDGSLYAVGQYSALFYLIGNTYGGSTGVTFAVPSITDLSTNVRYIIKI